MVGAKLYGVKPPISVRFGPIWNISRRRAARHTAIVEREDGAVGRGRRAAAIEQAGAGAAVDLSGGARLAGAGAVVAPALGNGVQLAVAGIKRDVAMAVVEARAEREVDVERAAVGDAALRTAEAARGEAGRTVDQTGDVIVVSRLLC